MIIHDFEIKSSEKGFIMENFILTFGIPEEACDALIEYHTQNEHDKTSTEQMWTKDQKEGIDVACYPKNQNPVIQNYLGYMFQGLDAYCEKYKHFKQKTVISQAFNIQYYPPNGGYKQWHNERSTQQTHQRSLVFMTYLNDLPDGGGTEFAYYPDFKVNAKKGFSMIWPTDFTHTHRGVISQHEKYIATGWFNH